MLPSNRIFYKFVQIMPFLKEVFNIYEIIMFKTYMSVHFLGCFDLWDSKSQKGMLLFEKRKLPDYLICRRPLFQKWQMYSESRHKYAGRNNKISSIGFEPCQGKGLFEEGKELRISFKEFDISKCTCHIKNCTKAKIT